MNAAAKMEEPTREQLQLAYRHLCRPGWPETLDAALQDRRISGLVRGLARSLNRVKAAQVVPQARYAWMPAAIRPMLSHEQPHFDARKAAANDRD